MATITTRAGKGSELTHNELDSNFTNLNNAKQENLVSGTNIKSVNGQSLVGSGNVDVGGGFEQSFLLMGA